MREINEAWETLRNPAARAAYDTKLHGEVEAATPELASVGYGYEFTTQRMHAGGAAWFADEPEVADIEKIDDGDDEPQKKRRFQAWHLGPLAVGGVALIIFLVLLVRTNNLDNQPNIVQTRERYGIGACVLVTPNPNGDNQVAEAPCNSPNNGKVVAKVEFPHPCPLQTYNVVLPAEQTSLCLQR